MNLFTSYSDRELLTLLDKLEMYRPQMRSEIVGELVRREFEMISEIRECLIDISKFLYAGLKTKPKNEVVSSNL
jgi:hypothetical protein